MRIVKLPPVAKADPPPVEHNVTIHEFEGNWHGVTYKSTQVSVGPDSSITLPKHLKPEEVEDFVAALRAAAPVAAEKAKAATNVQAGQADPRSALAQRLQQQGVLQALPAQGTPALPSPSKAAFTPERLARARAARKAGGES